MTGLPSYPGEKRRLLVFLTLAAGLHLAAGALWLAWGHVAPPAAAPGTLRIGLVVPAAPSSATPVTPDKVPARTPVPAVSATPTAAAAAQTSMSDNSAATPTATNTESSDARGHAQTSVADTAALRESWYAQVSAQLTRQMRYPRLARLRQLEGEALVSFELARDGRLLSSALRHSSGHALLDQAALELLAQAAPYPSPPGVLSAEDLQLQVPISYRLPH